MLNKALSDLIAYTVTTMSDRPAPTAAEILIAFSKLAEEAHRIGFENGDLQGFARGVIEGSKHTASVLDLVIGSDEGDKPHYDPDGKPF